MSSFDGGALFLRAFASRPNHFDPVRGIRRDPILRYCMREDGVQGCKNFWVVGTVTPAVRNASRNSPTERAVNCESLRASIPYSGLGYDC